MREASFFGFVGQRLHDVRKLLREELGRVPLVIPHPLLLRSLHRSASLNIRHGWLLGLFYLTPCGRSFLCGSFSDASLYHGLSPTLSREKRKRRRGPRLL